MPRKLIEYALVVLVAIIVSLLLIFILWPKTDGGCTGCTTVSLPEQRQECEKQFSGGVGSPRQLPAHVHDEYQVAFDDPLVKMSSSNPYNYGSSAPTSTIPTPTAGFVIVRARVASVYDPNTGSYGNNNVGSSTPPGKEWDAVRVAVVSYVSPLRNESVCPERGVRFFEDKFESFCDLPTRFNVGDAQRKDFRVFVINDSDVPVEYCIVSNCDQSQGKLCTIELASTP